MTRARPFCHIVAREHGLNPVGSAPKITRLIAVETPLPWKSPAYLSLQERVRPNFEKLYTAPNATALRQAHRFSQLLLLASNAHSVPEHTRVIVWHDSPDPFATFPKQEYLIPTWRMHRFALALTFKQQRLNEFERWTVDTAAKRDFLVCTHGTHDAAFGKFGYPLYEALRAQADTNTRVWRVSTFGSAVYAPSMIEFPAGIVWAIVVH